MRYERNIRIMCMQSGPKATEEGNMPEVAYLLSRCFHISLNFDHLCDHNAVGVSINAAQNISRANALLVLIS